MPLDKSYESITLKAMQLQLYRPTPSGAINENNGFGADPAYYAKFLDRAGNPQKGHPGIDFFAPHASPLYAVADGVAWYTFDSHGGDGIYEQVGPFDYQGEQAYFYIINWHLCSKDDPQFKPLIPTDGTRVSVKAGQLIGYTDNSGAPYESSGDHLHFGLMPVHANGQPFAPANGYDGCIDPAPYITGVYAGAIDQVKAIAAAAVPISQEIAAAPDLTPQQKVWDLQAIWNAVKGFFT
jgi:hypothetical protein